MEQEPQGIETFRTLAKLGLDTSPAITGAETLAESIKKLDSSLNSLIERSKMAGASLRDMFVKAERQEIQEMLKKQSASLESLIEAGTKKQLGLLQGAASRKVLIEQEAQKRILQMNQSFGQTLFQQAQAQQKKMEALAQGRLRGQMPFGEAALYRTSWFVSGAAFYGSLRAIRGIVDAASDMESILIELRKVMDERRTDFGAMRKTILDTAQAYGLLTEEVGKLAIEFGRQGRTQKEIEQLLRPASLLMNVAEIKSAEDAVRYLTAATRQFGLEAKDAMNIVDVLNVVSNNFGTSAEGIAQAVARAGSVAHTTGITLEEMAGHVAALSEATGKSGEEIGTALKTIYSYLLRPQTVKTLEEMGFRVREDADSYRDLADIIADIADKWNELTEVEQYHLAQKAAGVRRISDFIALLRTHNRAVEATIVAMAAAGSAERENQKLLESYRKQVAQLKATVQELAITLGEGALLPVLRGVVNGTKEAIEVYQKLDPTLRQLIETVGLLAAGLKALNMASMALGGQTLLARLGGLQAIKGIISSLLTSPWAQGTAITAITAGIGILSSGAVEKAKKDAADLAKRLEENQQAYMALTEVIAESEEGTLKHVTASRELQEVMNRFGSLAPEVVKKWDEMGNAIEIDTAVLERRIQKEKEFAGVTLEQLRRQMEDSAKHYKQLLNQREVWIHARIQMGLREAEAEAKTNEEIRKAHDKQIADTKAFYDALAQARAEGYRKAFGPPQQPKYRDPITGEWRPGMFPYREERHLGAEPEYWKGLDKELPAVERAKETLEKLTDAEKALALQHERELALLPAYATSIHEVTVRLRQNAESIEQARRSQAATLKERENIRKALEAEKKAYKDLEKEYNDLAREYAGVVQLPEDVKDKFDNLSKKLQEHGANIKSLEGQYDFLETKVKEYGNTVISLSTEGIQLDRERNRLLDEYNESLKKTQRTLQDLMNVERELAQLRSKQDWAEFLFGSGSPQAYEAGRAILLRQKEQINEEIRRLIEDFTAKYPDRELRGAPADVIAEFHTNMNKLLNERDAIDRELELQEAKYRKTREDKERETQRKIAENEITVKKASLDRRLAEIDAALEYEDKESEAYFNLQQERDRILIQQKRLNIEALRAQQKEADLLDLPALVAQIGAEENEILKLQAGMDARLDAFVKARIKKLAELDLAVLEITDPIAAAFAKAQQRVGEAFKDVVGRDDEKQRMLMVEHWKVWRDIYEEQANKIVEDIYLELPEKIKQLQGLNMQLMEKSLDGVTGSPQIANAVKQFAKEFVDKQNAALRESLIARGFGLDLELAEAGLEKDLHVRARRRAEAIEKYLREDIQKITGSLLLTPEQQIAKLDELLDKYIEFREEVPEVYALLAKAREDLTARTTEQFRKYLAAIGQETRAELDAVEDLAKGYNLKTEEGRIQWEAVRAAERGKVWAKVADEQVQAILDNVYLRTTDKLQALRNLNAEFLVKGVEGIAASDKIQESIKKLADTFMTEYLDSLKEALDAQGLGMERELAEVLVSGKPAEVMEKLTRDIIDKYIGQGISRISSNVLFGLGDKERELLALQEKFLPYAERFPDLYAQIGESLKEVRREQAELNAALKEAGLEPYSKAVEAASNALEQFNLENKQTTVDVLQERLRLTRAVMEAQQKLYDEQLKAAKEAAQEAGVSFETVLAGGEPLARLRETLKPEAQRMLDLAVRLAGSLEPIRMNIVRLKVDIADLGKEITLLPIQEKFTALNSSLEEFSRFMTQAAFAEEYFAEGLFADVKRMELLRQKMQATKQVAEAYRDALVSTREKLLASKELTDEEMKLVEAVASGTALTKEQSIAWTAMLAKYEQADKAIHTLLVALKSLRDENGNLSKSILDSAFSLYRATLAAKGLVKAYDAIISGVEELRDTFDSYGERRAMEEQFNFNYIFGRPAERMMEDWQHEYDRLVRQLEAIAQVRAGLVKWRESAAAQKEAKATFKELASELGIDPKLVETLGDVSQAEQLVIDKTKELGGALHNLVSKRYFLELAREAEEMGRSFEQNIEGAFERAISDVIKGEGDLLNILVTFGQNIVGSMADMLAQGLTRRIFGDPNDPNSLAGQITAWATGQAGDTLGIQTGITTGAQVAGSTMQTAIITGGQQVASMWSAVLRTAPIGMPMPGLPMPGLPEQGSVAGWRMLEAASMAGTSSVAGWRMLENASMAGAAAGGGGFLSALLGGTGAPLLAGFNPIAMLATFAIGTLLSGIQKKLSQPLAPTPKDQYYYKIYSPEFNPFASPERVYYAGTGREMTEVANFTIQPGAIVVHAQDGTDAGKQIATALRGHWEDIRRMHNSGSWGPRK